MYPKHHINEIQHTMQGQGSSNPHDNQYIGRSSPSKHQRCYPLVMTNSLLLKMTIEIVDFPMKNGGSFHSKLLVYQRVNMVQ